MNIEDTTTPSELITLSYAYESYFSLILDNVDADKKIPNMGVIYRDTLYELNKEFLDNGMVFGSSGLGVSIQVHLNIVVMQAMKALSMYMTSIMAAKHASSLEQQAKYLEDAKEYLDKYKDLCDYVEKYTMSQSMDKSMEEAIDDLKDRKDEDIDKDRMNEAADKLDEKDDEKRKGEELNNEEVNQAVEDKTDEVREKIENEKEEEEVKEEQEELDNDSKEIKPEDTKDELIPGTNINKPRDRGVYESDEEYVDFLKDYYEKVFGPEEAKTNIEEVKIDPEDMKDELIPGTDIHRPRDRGVYESDEEYVNFLKDYYDKTFGPEVVAKSLEPKAEVQTTSTVPTVTEIVPTAEHDQELSMMMNDLGNMPKEVPTKTNGTELDSMFKGNAVMNPNGTTTTISPAVMTK